MDNNQPILKMTGIEKSFGKTQVLKGVDLTLYPGQVLGLLGENGAGKSTLMKILCGLYKKDAGTIWYDGKERESLSPSATQKLGISIIYQELSVILDLNAAENIFINREIAVGNSGSLIAPLNNAKMKQEAYRILHDEMDMDINLDIPTRYLTLAQRQMIEIARSLVNDVNIIIMDEPTAALEKHERNQLFKLINRLKERGTAIVFVSHILEEIFTICDSALILRDGFVAADKPTSELDVDQIINHMIGKPLEKQYPKYPVPIGEEVLRTENLSDRKNFKDVSIVAKAGEIVGIAGLEGSGKSEVIRTIFGIAKPTAGDIYIHGEKTKIRSIRDAMNHKLAFMPAERKLEGLFLDHDIAWNTTIAGINKIEKGYLRSGIETEATEKYIDALSIKTTGPKQVMGDLSGGNQQKVLISRWLYTEPDVMMMQEPTRGIDVNARADVYGHIMTCAAEGKAVVLVSSDSQELLGMCDRIYVMYEGKVVAEVSASEATEEMLAQYSVNATGDKNNE